MLRPESTRLPALDGALAVTVYGTPIPQGSKTANRYGRGVRDANAAKLAPWRDRVKAHAEDAARYYDTFTGPVQVWVRFTFDRPDSHRRQGRNAHLIKASAPPAPIAKQDVDKLQRAVFDSLTDAGVWTDDGLVVDVRARKFYAGEHELALDRAGVQIIVAPAADHTSLATLSAAVEGPFAHGIPTSTAALPLAGGAA